MNRDLDLQLVRVLRFPEDGEDAIDERGQFLIRAVSDEGRTLALPINVN